MGLATGMSVVFAITLSHLNSSRTASLLRQSAGCILRQYFLSRISVILNIALAPCLTKSIVLTLTGNFLTTAIASPLSLLICVRYEACSNGIVLAVINTLCLILQFALN